MPPNTAPRPVGQSKTRLEPGDTAELDHVLIQRGRSQPNPSQAENTVYEEG